MHRRRLLGFLLSAAAAPLLSASGVLSSRELPAATTPHVLFLGLGGAGGNFANGLPEALRALPDSPRAWTVAVLRGEGLPAIVAQHGGMPAEFDRVVLLAGLGSYAGGELAVKYAGWYRQAGVPVAAVVCLPFGFEGPDRRVPAHAQLAALAATGCPLAVLRNDDLLARLPPGTSMRAAFSHSTRMAVRHALAAAWPA